MSKMIEIHQEEPGGPGYVWDAQDAIDLRGKHRLLGLFIGGVAHFKSQNDVAGLPLRLGPDEVHFASSRGHALVRPPALQSEQATLAPHTNGTDPPTSSTAAGTSHQPYNKRARRYHADSPNMPAWLASYYDYYRDYYPPEANDQHQQQPPQPPHATTGAQGQQHDKRPETVVRNMPHWLRSYYQYYYETDHVATNANNIGGQGQAPAAAVGEGLGAGPRTHTPQQQGKVLSQAGGQGASQPWQKALQDGSKSYVLPIAAERPAAAAALAGAAPRDAPPASKLDATRETVFADMHSKGYALSAGPKFGADMLAYPGDPCLYHSQFTVRFLEPDQPINPIALKAAARGSHSTRKHLVLAALPDTTGEGHAGAQAGQTGAQAGTESSEGAGTAARPSPIYVCIAPEKGFGRT